MVCSIPPLPTGLYTLNYALFAPNVVGIVAADIDLIPLWKPDATGRPIGEPWRAAETATAHIFLFDHDALVPGPSFPLLTPFPLVERFSDGRWIVAPSRTLKMNSTRLLTADGSELNRLHLGDGINHLKVDGTDLIWVGWFDEGVFGNTDWHDARLGFPPSSNGLAAFDTTGRAIASATGAPQGAEIADCYALNVFGDTAWSVTYPECPIACTSAAQPSRWWQSPYQGVSAIAVAPPFVLLAGGYDQDAQHVALARLRDTRIERIDEWELPAEVSERALLDARGDVLTIVANNRAYRWSVSDFVAAVP